MSKQKLDEGLLSKLVGKAIVALSGAGKHWKKIKKMQKDPEVRDAFTKMNRSSKEMAEEYAKIMKSIYGDNWKAEL